MTRRWSVAPAVSRAEVRQRERAADHRPRGEHGRGRAAARVGVGRAGLRPGDRALVDHHLQPVRRVGVEQRARRRRRRQRDRGEIERARVDQVDAALDRVAGRDRRRADVEPVRRGARRAERDRDRARGDGVARRGRAREGREGAEAGDAGRRAEHGEGCQQLARGRPAAAAGRARSSCQNASSSPGSPDLGVRRVVLAAHRRDRSPSLEGKGGFQKATPKRSFRPGVRWGDGDPNRRCSGRRARLAAARGVRARPPARGLRGDARRLRRGRPREERGGARAGHPERRRHRALDAGRGHADGRQRPARERRARRRDLGVLPRQRLRSRLLLPRRPRRSTR